MNGNAIQVLNPLDLLEKVNTFYETSWSHLLIYSGVLIAVIGIIVPILIQIYQARSLRKEEAAINARIDHLILKGKEALRVDLQNELDSHRAKMDALASRIDAQLLAETEKIRKELEGTMEAVKQELNQTIEGTSAGVAHVQGMMFIGSKHYAQALDSFIGAAISQLGCQDEGNLRRVMNLIKEACLPHLMKSDIDQIPTIRANFSNLIKELRKQNKRERYTDDIERLERDFRNASERQPEPAKKTMTP